MVQPSQHKKGARFMLNIPWTWKSFWAHPMILLGDMGQVEDPLSLFGDSVSVGAI